MYSILIMIFIVMLIFIMILLNFLLSKKLFKYLEKSSPFECGFDSIGSSRMPFSLQFYLISMIFLIFDVEIAMILPMIISKYYLSYFLTLNFFLIFSVLLIGLYLEWYEGALKWIK